MIYTGISEHSVQLFQKKAAGMVQNNVPTVLRTGGG